MHYSCWWANVWDACLIKDIKFCMSQTLKHNLSNHPLNCFNHQIHVKLHVTCLKCQCYFVVQQRKTKWRIRRTGKCMAVSYLAHRKTKHHHKAVNSLSFSQEQCLGQEFPSLRHFSLRAILLPIALHSWFLPCMPPSLKDQPM